MTTSFDRRDQLLSMLGPISPWALGSVEIVEEVQGDGYLRRQVAYDVPSGRASAFVCLPEDPPGPAPLVYCHHQHNGVFDLGKSEVVGLRGNPDQVYAIELARRGFVTIAADAIGFEDRNWSGDQNIGWFELSSRLDQGRTLLADELQEISLAIDYGLSLPEVRAGDVGFIGHSFGGRMALWAPFWDRRIRTSVSNCGCISYRESTAHDAGFQADVVAPGIAGRFDVEDLVELAEQCSYLVIAGDDDVWSRGAGDLRETAQQRGMTNLEMLIRAGGHEFPESDRERSYTFLTERLHPSQPTPSQPTS